MMESGKCPILIPDGSMVWVNTPTWATLQVGEKVKECYYTLTESTTLSVIKLNEADNNYYAEMLFPLVDGESHLVYGDDLNQLKLYVIDKYEKFILKLF